MRNALSKTLIFIGVLVLLVSSVMLWRRNDPGRLQFEPINFETEKASGNLAEPTGIVMDSLAIKLPVIPAAREGNRWQTTTAGVSYLVGSPKPGELGNSILYGHNWGSILGSLYKARPGQKIEVYYSDGTSREFEISYVQEVTPKDVSVLSATTDRRITLYTCSGLFDQKRLVVTALLI